MRNHTLSTVNVALLRAALLLAALAVTLTLTACGNEKQIPVTEALPPGVTDAAVPSAFASGVPGLGVSEMWMRGFTSDAGWEAAIQHTEEVATKNGYHKATTPEVPNIEKVGLTKEDVYQFWLSQNGKYGLGLMNIKLLRSKSGAFDGNADYLIFCGGGSMKPH